MLDEILASIALYILTMLMLALATEIVVDVLKLAVGLENKPKARQTLAQFRDLMPGKLDIYKLDLDAEKKLQRHISALHELLRPVVLVEDVLIDLHQGYVGDVVQTVLRQAESGELPGGRQLVAHVRKQMHQAVQQIAGELGISQQVVAPILRRFDEALDGLASTEPVEVLRWAVTHLQNGMINLAMAWARNQKSLILAGMEETVRHRYRTVVRPQLAGFGFSNSDLAAVNQWFNSFVEQTRDAADDQADVYLESLNKLLRGVESQRYEMQSPSRKAWRRLRVAPGLGSIVVHLEDWWNRLLGRQVSVYGQPSLPPPISDVTEAARIVSDVDQLHILDDKHRIYLLRFVAVLVGVTLAYLLRIDTGDLLSGLLPAAALDFLATTLIRAGEHPVLLFDVTLRHPLTGGILLTGLAASAGSSFWHEQLARFKTVRQAGATAAAIVREAMEKEKESNRQAEPATNTRQRV